MGGTKRYGYAKQRDLQRYTVTSLAIAVCSHNPDERTLERLLTAIANLDGLDLVESVIIVDNNSSPKLDTKSCVSNFLQQSFAWRCVHEQSPGLTAARCRAIRETEADVVVFFDDDNEPAPDYLAILLDHFARFPDVGVWGPGTVTVEFLDATPDAIRRRPDLFQEARRPFGYACINGYFGEVSPLGTGFAVRREVLERFESMVAQGILCSTDRSGKSLASGGDVQIVWEATKMDLASGVIPELQCNHLIGAEKANEAYLVKLTFGCAASYAPALLQSYPDIAKQLIHPPSLCRELKSLFLHKVKRTLKPHRSLSYRLIHANELGKAYGNASVCSPKLAIKLKSLAIRLGYI